MAAKSKVSQYDYHSLSDAEKQFVELYGLEALNRGMKLGRSSPALQGSPQGQQTDFAIVGKDHVDLEGHEIVTGRARYTVDVYLSDMAYVKGG